MEIIICDDNLSERSLMIDYILKWASEKHLEIQINTCKDWMELAAALEGREWDIVIVSLDGVRGLDTASSAQPLSRRLIWISDLDFGGTGIPYVCQLFLHEAGQLPENAAGSGVCSERAGHNVISGGM